MDETLAIEWMRYFSSYAKRFYQLLEELLEKQSVILQEIQKMSTQTDALAAEVDKLVPVIDSAVKSIDAMAEAQAQFQTHLNGDALDSAAVQAATDKLSAARESLAAELAKLSPAATGNTGTQTSSETTGS